MKSNFNRDKNRYDGLQPHRQNCRKKYKKEFYEKNRDKCIKIVMDSRNRNKENCNRCRREYYKK